MHICLVQKEMLGCEYLSYQTTISYSNMKQNHGMIIISQHLL